MAWYVNANGTTFGPAEDAQVIEWIRSGRMLHATMICYVGSQQWVELASYPPFAEALRFVAPPPPPMGMAAPVQPRPAAPKSKPTDPRLKLVIWVLVLLLVSFTSAWLGLVLSIAMLGSSEFARRKRKQSFVGWVLRREPSQGLVLASLVLGAVMFVGGSSRAIAGWMDDLSARRAAQAKEADMVKRQADLLASVPTRIAGWRAKLSEVQSAAETTNYFEGGLTTVDGVTADVTALTTQLGSATPPEVAQVKADAAAVREKYEARTEFNAAVNDFGQQVVTAKQQATTKQWLAADQACGAALQDLDTLSKAAPWLAPFLPAGFDIASKQKDVSALRSQIAGPVAAERQRAERAEAARQAKEAKEEAARQAKEAKEAAYAAVCGEKPGLSAWDGELIGVASVLKESANDPDSIEVKNCTPPGLSSDNCWISTCDVRGKNAFGAKILKRITFSKSKLGFQQISE
jgi:hypothetical protein